MGSNMTKIFDKRFFYFAIVVIMLLTALPVSALSGDLLSESFDGYTAGEDGEITAPDGWSAGSTDKTSKGVRAAKVPGNNTNSLRLCTTAKGSAFIKRTDIASLSDWSGKTVIELNVRAESYSVERDALKISDSSGMAYTMIHLSADGYIYSDAKDMSAIVPIAEYRTGRWYNFAVVIDTQNVSYDLYIDGVKILNEAYFTDDPLSDINELEIAQNGQKGISGLTFIDDVRIYTAVTPDRQGKTYPKADYESTIVVPLPANYAGAVGGGGGSGNVNVLASWDFDNYTVTETSEKNSGPDYFDVYDNNGKIYSAVADAAHGRSVAIKGATAGEGAAINKAGLSSMIQGDTIFEAELKINQPSLDCSIQYEAQTGNGTPPVTLAHFETTGNISLKSSGGQMSAGTFDTEWHVYSIVFHISTSTYDFYVDYQERASNLILNSPNAVTEIKRIKFGFGGSSTNTGYLDNFTLYKADRPQKIQKAVSTPSNPAQDKENTVFDSEPDFSANIADGAALYLGSANAYANGRRSKIDPDNSEITPMLVNNRTLVPVRFISETFGADIEWRQYDRSVNIKSRNNEIRIVVDSDVMQVNGSDISLDSPALEKGGRVFLPLRAFSEAIGKQVYYNQNGLIVIGNNAEPFPAADAKKLTALVKALRFERPTRQEILAAFQKKYPTGGSHPRILMTQDKFNALKQSVTTDTNLKKWYPKLLEKADAIIPQAVSVWGITAGSSGDMLWTMREIKYRVETLGLAYKLTGLDKYKNRLYAEALAAANFKNWDVGQQLDVEECAYALALAYDWLYNDWTQAQRDVIKNGLMDKGLRVTMAAYKGTGDSGWTKLEGNWSLVCNGSNIVTALTLMDEEPEFAAQFMEYAFRSLEYGLLGFEPEGAWDEGMGYWAYALRYYVPAMDALMSSLGTEFGYYKNIKGASETGFLQPYMTGPTGNFNYHDAGDGIENESSLFWFANQEKQPGLNNYRLGLMNTNLDKYLQAYDIMWYNPAMTNSAADLPLDVFYSGTVQTALFRSAWNDNAALWGGLHAGPNNVGHTNLDVGTFVLDALGQRWAVDLGMEDYARSGYFDLSGGRFVYYRTRAEGQNTIVVNPGTLFDQDLSAEGSLVSFEAKPRGAFAVMDVSSMKKADIEQARRGMFLTDDRTRFILQDEMTLKKPSELYWFMHTRAAIDIANNGRSAVLTQGGKKMHAAIVSSNQALQFEKMAAIPLPNSPKPDANNPNNPNNGIQKLFINASNVSELNLSVVFTPMPAGVVPTILPPFTPMSQWSVPDGAIQAISHLNLSSISLDGKPLDNFTPEQHSYTVDLSSETVAVPVIAADYAFSGGEIEIVQAQGFDDSAKIIITDNETKKQQFYVVDFVQATYPDRPSGLTKYAIKSVEASEAPQPENPPQNAIDGNLSTRWSAEHEQWITADLGEVKQINAVTVGWYMGKERKTRYDVLVSVNGRRWKTVYSGWSGGEAEFDTSLFTRTDARYIRIKGYENTVNSWVSVAEIEIYGK